jgi:hypothetical protein
MLYEGALVRVRDSATSPDEEYSELNREMLAEHGYLYLVVEHDEGRDIYMCKSLATGEDCLPWLAHEIEAVEPDDD